ncbi:MAG: aspartate carbamoyltransferase [Promethearchaeota archaeon]
MTKDKPLQMSHLVSIQDISERDILKILDYAQRIKQNPSAFKEQLPDKILALAFWEPSTRTRLSFESAMLRLGGRTVGFSTPAGTSVEKGESLTDTIMMLVGYADGIVLRHPKRGSAKLAANVADKHGVPVISGGSGSQEHPTQALLDIFTIREKLGHLSGLNVGIMGDLRYSRTISSLLFALSKFGRNSINLISHPLLSLQEELRFDLEKSNLEFTNKEDLSDIMKDLDVLYVTRLQKERFPDPMLFDKVKGAYKLKPRLLSLAKSELLILHPLPRVDEIPYDIDRFPQASYFEQAQNGVFVRMALLDYLLGDKHEE